jgi:hypothetical protein
LITRHAGVEHRFAADRTTRTNAATTEHGSVGKSNAGKAGGDSGHEDSGFRDTQKVCGRYEGIEVRQASSRFGDAVVLPAKAGRMVTLCSNDSMSLKTAAGIQTSTAKGAKTPGKARVRIKI